MAYTYGNADKLSTMTTAGITTKTVFSATTGPGLPRRP